MGAREIIGLEAALGELGELYGGAKRFRALGAQAEGELLPRIEAIAAHLRSLVRQDTLDASSVDAAAAEISALRARWQNALDEVRAGDAYRAALEAWHAGRQDRLRELLPAVLAGLQAVDPPPRLFLGVSLSSGRRRPGTSPFLAPREAAEKVEAIRRQGIPVDENQRVRPGAAVDDWWDAELAHHELYDDQDAVESPLALTYAGPELGLPVFAVAGELGFRLFRLYPRVLAAPFSIALRAEAEDEWWQALEEPYAAFRDALAAELRARGFAVEIA